MIPHKVMSHFEFLAVLSIGIALAAHDWVIRDDGVGPVKIGMNLSQLNAALHEKFAVPKTKDVNHFVLVRRPHIGSAHHHY